MSSVSSFSNTSLRNFAGLRSPGAPPWRAVRRKFATETPGIAAGYWNDRNSPALGALVGRQSEQVLTVERHRAAEHR
jgi:hypothetical protein